MHSPELLSAHGEGFADHYRQLVSANQAETHEHSEPPVGEFVPGACVPAQV